MTSGLIRASSKEADAFADITHRLRQYRSMVANYQACRQLYDELFPSCTPSLTGMPRTETDTYEPERWAQKRISQREMMERSLDAMREAYEESRRMIDLVSGNYNTVLMRRYMLNESWEIIADKMHCHRHTAASWHDRAIYEIIKRLDSIGH
jgi:hypothetical protein